jgi:hypothetical protein
VNDKFEDWFIESDASVFTLQQKQQLQAAFEAGAAAERERCAGLMEQLVKTAQPGSVRDTVKGCAMLIRGEIKG